MKKTNNLLTLLSAIVLLVSSCTKEPLRGHGDIITETRSLSSFKKLSLSESMEIEVIKSIERKVEITGYANLVAALETKNSNQRLMLDYGNRIWVRNDNVKLKIFTPDIEAIEISGSSNVILRTGFSGRLDVNISGSGSLYTDSTNFDHLNLNISGSGNINTEPATTKNAEAHIGGSGKIKVRVSEFLKVRIGGNGEVKYWGNPQTDVNISGNGKVLRQ